jgi:hypothetical protein
MLRLRQIALVAQHLEPVVADLQAVLGLGEPFHDPGVATFGLHNAVLPAGCQFIEVVAPVREGTAGGRYLERRGGDGGYMVILQCDDHPALKARAAAAGVRVAFAHDTEHYRICQLHPRDTGGSFLEVDVQVGGEAPDGPWEPGGPDWQQRRTGPVAAITRAEVQCDDPSALAARWAAILGVSATGGGDAGSLVLDNATLRFVTALDGRGEGLGGITVSMADSTEALVRADERGLTRFDEATVLLGGVRVRLEEHPTT